MMFVSPAKLSSTDRPWRRVSASDATTTAATPGGGGGGAAYPRSSSAEVATLRLSPCVPSRRSSLDGTVQRSDVEATDLMGHVTPQTVTRLLVSEKPAPLMTSSAPPARLTVAGESPERVRLIPVTVGRLELPRAEPPTFTRVTACEPESGGLALRRRCVGAAKALHGEDYSEMHFA